MIQRIQSIYLIFISLLSGVLVFFLKLGIYAKKGAFGVLDLFYDSSLLLKSISINYWIVAILAFISLLSYKKRKLQININRFNIIINLILLGLLCYHLFNISGETIVSEKGIGSFIPLGSIVLLVLANRAIQKDEKLVKSIDRLR